MGYTKQLSILEGRIIPVTIGMQCLFCKEVFARAPKDRRCVQFGKWYVFDTCWARLQGAMLRIVPESFIPGPLEEREDNVEILTASLREIAAKNVHYHCVCLGVSRFSEDQWPDLIRAILDWQYEIPIWRYEESNRKRCR